MRRTTSRILAVMLSVCMTVGLCITGYAEVPVNNGESQTSESQSETEIDSAEDSGLTVENENDNRNEPALIDEQAQTNEQALIDEPFLSEPSADTDEPAAVNELMLTGAPAVIDEPVVIDDPVVIRDAQDFPFDDYLDALKLVITDANGEHMVDYKDGVPTDMDMGEIQRNATLSITLAFQPNTAAGNTGGTANPIIYGDTFSCAVPDTISNANGGKWTGRLKDPTTSYGNTNGSVGDFVIENGQLTIKFDEGYIKETGGNIKNASMNYTGSFDAYGWDETAFEKQLYFGNLPVTVHFPAANVLRNLSIEKTPVNYGNSDYSYSVSGLQGRGELNGTAKIGADGYMTYSIKVTAAEDNTTFLDNVIISDVFTTDNVDPASVVLVKAVKGARDTDITSEAAAQRDDAGNITGWNVGRLNRGESATVTFKIKIDKEKITEAVDAVRHENPDASAEEARLLKNTASATADMLPKPVTVDAAAKVQNYLSVAKSKDGSYDPVTNRQKFKITITASADNKYTERDILIEDKQDSYDKWYTEIGISGMSIKHADGTVTESTETDPLYYGFETDSSVKWHAYLKELAPGDVATIYTYAKIDPDLFYTEADSNGMSGPNNVYNYIYAGGGDLRQSCLYCSYYITKQWISKSGNYSSADGTITWTMTGNSYDSDVPDADITGMRVQDILGLNQKMADSQVLVTFYEPNSSSVRSYDGDDSQDGKMVVPATDNGFTFNIPNGFGDCKFTVTYKTIVENNYGPAASYYNTGKLGPWTYSASTTRPRIAAIEKIYLEHGEDWAKWGVNILGPVKAGDALTDTLDTSPTLMWFDAEDIDGIEVSFNGKTIDGSLYNIVPTASTTEGKNKGFTLTFLSAITDTGTDGKEITPTSQNPVTITYKSHLAYRTYGDQTRYYNSASYISDGVTVDTSYTYFYRSTYPEITKKYKNTVGSDITWTLKLNEHGYGCYLIDENKNPVYYQNNGGGEKSGYYTIVTETIPKGLKYVTAAYNNTKGYYAKVPTIEELSKTENEDGSTTVKLLIGNLVHYEANPDNTSAYRNSGYYYVDINIVTQIVDQECLLDTTGKDFTWDNAASVTSMDGQPYEAKASMNIAHVALSKTMKYDGSTAPNAQFTIDMNNEEFDLDPDSDTIKVFDKSSSSLTVDTSSIKVIDTRDNSPVDFILDAGQMSADGTFSLEVPDNLPLRITYEAGVSGVKGEEVTVSNNAYFEGQKIEEVTSRIEQVVTVLNAEAQAESDVMVWLKKMDAKGKILPGCVFKLEQYSADDGWTVVNEEIITADDTEYATKVGGLNKNILYRLTETKAAENYILDATPQYFCLKVSQDSAVDMPEDFAENVNYCNVASLLNAYNKPYVPVTFRKLNGDGAPLPGAEFKVTDPDGKTVKDKDGKEIVFTTEEEEATPPTPPEPDNPDAPTPPTPPAETPDLASIMDDGENGDGGTGGDIIIPDDASKLPTFYVEPGTYQLVETTPPTGYFPAAPITFTANTDKTVSVGNRRVENNVVVCTDEPTTVTIRKMDGAADPETPLIGAVLQILNGDVVADEWTTDGTDHTITAVLNVNTEYNLHESSAPDGYLLANDISFKINDDGTLDCSATLDDGSSVVDENGVLVMVDQKPSLDIVKVNHTKHTDVEAGAPLEGVSLTISTADGEIRTWTTAVTDEEPAVAVAEHFDNLEAGIEYTITENDAPAGYVVIDPFTVTLNADGTCTVTGEDASYEDGVLTVKNNYVPTPVELELTVYKAIDGDPVSDKVFTFELSDDEGNTEEITITGEGDGTFAKMTFTEAGTYNYTIKEVAGEDKGYTYASDSHTVVVEIDDDGLGTLSKTVKIDGEETEELTITNTYAPVKVELPLTIVKAFTQDSAERPTMEDYTFTIAGSTGTEPLPAVTSVTANETTAGVFNNITYTAVGTYEYTITEANDGKAGYTYADPVNIKVVVKDLDGKLGAAVFIGTEEQSNIKFTNSYTPAGTSLSVGVKKTITADSAARPKVEDFTFTIAGKNGTEPLPAETTVTANETAAGAFEDIPYTVAGTYEYTITETNDGKAGYTYAAPIDIKVEVEDIGGQLEAKMYIGDEYAEDAEFVNSYTPVETSLPITVKKAISADSAARPSAADFTFTIKGRNGNEPLPETTEVTANELLPGVFTDITYTAAGTYEYTITETDDRKTGYTYAAPIDVKVVVTDTAGQLGAVMYIGVEEAKEVVFTNSYTPIDTSLSIPVTKAFTADSADRPTVKDFTFTIAGKNGTEPLPAETTVTASETTAGAFEDIPYTVAGTYEYTITETNDGKTGYTYADPIDIKVVVTDTAGQLGAELYIGDERKTDVEFTNSYTPVETSLTVPVAKVFTADSADRPTVEDFTFTITGKNGDEPLPTEITVTANETAAGAFEDIPYTAAGTYEYTITETDDGKAGYTYADPIDIKVVVTDTAGELGAELYIGSDTVTGVSFTNGYMPNGTSLTVPVTKSFTSESQERPTEEDFTFEIAGKLGTEPMPAKTTVTASETAAGAFADIPYTEAGTYEYIITEIDDGKAGYTYADPIEIKVVVTDTAGQLGAELYIGSEKVTKVEVINSYIPEETSLTVPVAKVFTADSAERPAVEDFTFTIAGKNGDEPLPTEKTVTANEDEAGAFNDITFTAAGTYEYTITEMNDGKAGYTYADPIDIKVIVTDEKGQLTAVILIGSEEQNCIVFENRYQDPEKPADEDKPTDDEKPTESESPSESEKPSESQKPTSTETAASDKSNHAAPVTGDNSPILLWSILCIIAASVIVGIILGYRRRDEQ